MTQISKKHDTPKVIIANRLDDGRTVFFSANNTQNDDQSNSQSNRWTSSISQAVIAETPEQAALLLDRAQKDHDSNLVIAPMAIDAVLSGGGTFTARDTAVTAKHIKYQIQSTGPTVRPDLALSQHASTQQKAAV